MASEKASPLRSIGERKSGPSSGLWRCARESNRALARAPVSSSQRPFNSQNPVLLRRNDNSRLGLAGSVSSGAAPAGSRWARMRAPRAATCLRPASEANVSRCCSASSRCSGGICVITPTIVSIIGLLNRPSAAAAPLAGAKAGMGVPSRVRLGVRARARLTTVSAADLGTSAKCSKSPATELYPNNSITPRDSISASRVPISASADRTTVSSAETRSAKATASACHTVSLSTQQDYRQPNADSSLAQLEAVQRQGHHCMGNRRSGTERQARTRSADFPRPGEAVSVELKPYQENSRTRSPKPSSIPSFQPPPINPDLPIDQPKVLFQLDQPAKHLSPMSLQQSQPLGLIPPPGAHQLRIPPDHLDRHPGGPQPGTDLDPLEIHLPVPPPPTGSAVDARDHETSSFVVTQRVSADPATARGVGDGQAGLVERFDFEHAPNSTVGGMKPTLVLAICCASIVIAVMDISIVTVALPSIRHDLGASTEGLQWTIDAYTLVLAGFLVLAGSTADRFGRKRVFLTGLAVFGVGSLLCSVAPGIGWLIAARAVQAVGGTMLNPVALAIVVTTFPAPAERARAIGVFGSMSGLALALGPILGGLLVDSLGWRAVFWVSVPILAVAIVATAAFVPESRAARARRFDPVGQELVVHVLGSVVVLF